MGRRNHGACVADQVPYKHAHHVVINDAAAVPRQNGDVVDSCSIHGTSRVLRRPASSPGTLLASNPPATPSRLRPGGGHRGGEAVGEEAEVSQRVLTPLFRRGEGQDTKCLYIHPRENMSAREVQENVEVREGRRRVTDVGSSVSGRGARGVKIGVWCQQPCVLEL